MENEKILFESRGLPKKLKYFLIFVSIVWVCMAVLQMSYFFASSYKKVSGRKKPFYVAEMNGDAGGQKPQASFGGRDILNIIGFCYAAAIGTACVAFSIGGSKLSMRVYESHIEGRASVSAKIKDVYIAFDRISAISAASNIGSKFSYIGCELYYLEVHTQEGFEIVFYLDEENVDRVSQMLRDIIKINGKKMESDRV